MRPIDADALMLKARLYEDIRGDGECAMCVTDNEIISAPTIDPVTHGKWKNRQMHDEELMPISVFRHRCSVCNFEINTTEETIWWRWCPGCGARMDADDWEEPKINPCRGCEDYDGRGGCTSHGACVAERSEE